MTPRDLLVRYRSQASIVRALAKTAWPATAASVSAWFVEGRVPLGRQCQFQILTKGGLTADERVPPEDPGVIAA